MGRMPNGERAIVDLRKLEDYCLSPLHVRGRHKARVFARRSASIARMPPGSDKRCSKPRARAKRSSRSKQVRKPLAIDTRLTRIGRTAVVRSVWIIRSGEDIPRFVTAWVL